MPYTVSDSSFKQQRGTSTFLLEGQDGEANHVAGLNEIPGAEEDQPPLPVAILFNMGQLRSEDNMVAKRNTTTSSTRLSGSRETFDKLGQQGVIPTKPVRLRI
jgi:hypothetical protein